MRILAGLLLFLCIGAAMAQKPPGCEEWAQKTEKTFRKMDEALKLKTGMLLGEMEAAKGALEGCIEQNKGVSTRMAMVWGVADFGLLTLLGLMVFHQRRMKRAVTLLSRLLQAKDPAHPVQYVPSQELYWIALGVIGSTFLLVNFFALVL